MTFRMLLSARTVAAASTTTKLPGVGGGGGIVAVAAEQKPRATTTRAVSVLGTMLPSVELYQNQGFMPTNGFLAQQQQQQQPHPAAVSNNRFNVAEYCADKSVILLGLPGAFRPTCSARMIPNYKEHYDALQQAGVEAVIVYAVNDAMVMQAWARDRKIAPGVSCVVNCCVCVNCCCV